LCFSRALGSSDTLDNPLISLVDTDTRIDYICVTVFVKNIVRYYLEVSANKDLENVTKSHQWVANPIQEGETHKAF